MSGPSSSDPESWTDLFLHSLGAHEAARAKPRLEGQPSIPRYEIRERVGEGATAVVFRAWDKELKRTVALKVLRGRAAMNPVMRERFQREAQAAAGLDHPHVIRVYDTGEHEGDLYLVLEFVPGGALRTPASERDSAALLEKVARGVAAAHANGIVHRDVKPGNILMTDAGEPKVGDFGLAHVMDSESRLTQTGSSLGTPMYMAPEQVEGRKNDISPRTDVYALGAVLYEMLAGRPPFVGETAAEIYRKILQDEVERPAASPALQTIILKALDKDPQRRYSGAAEFADDLGRFLRSEPILGRPESSWTRFCRRARRHRAVWIPTVAAAVLLAAVLGLQTVSRKFEMDGIVITAAELESAGGVQKAREMYLQVVGQDPTHERARAGVERTDLVIKRVQSLLEAARPGLEQATAALYSANVPHSSLVDRVGLAQKPIEEAVRLANDVALVHHRQGELWEILGYYERAEAAWRKAQEVDPKFGPAHFRLGRILVWRAYQASLGYAGDDLEDRASEARRLADEAIHEIDAARKESAGFDDPIQADIAAAMSVFLRKLNDQVHEMCAESIQKHVGRQGVEEFWWLMGLVSKSKTDKRRCLDQAINLRPKFPLALFSRAVHLAANAELTEALRDYDRVIELCPTFAEAYVNRGSLRFRLKDARGATEDFETLMKLGVRLGAAYTGRARTRFELQGDAEGALADFAESLRHNPNHYLPYQARARLHLAKGNLDGAIADSTRSLELQKDAVSLLTRFRARALKGDLAAALEDGRAYLKETPKDAEVQKEVEELQRRLPK
jgi:tetratricopeptide (TPR) repeat protein/tRNA A-37 threonylcarbamoyl transferase component Bud32